MNNTLHSLSPLAATLVLGLAVAACSSAPPEAPSETPAAAQRIEVGGEGVSHAQRDGDGYALLDSQGRAVGRATIARDTRTTRVVITLRGAETTFSWDDATFEAKKAEHAIAGRRVAGVWTATSATDRAAFDAELAVLVALGADRALTLPGIEATGEGTRPQMDGTRCYESTGYNLYSCSNACSNACTRPNNPVSCDGSQDSNCSASWFWYSCTVRRCYASTEIMLEY